MNINNLISTKTIHSLSVDNLNLIVREVLAPLTDTPEKYEDWEAEAEFEWYDANYSSTIDKDDHLDSIYIKWDRPDIMAGKSTGIHQILTFLLDHGLLEPGEYLIDATC